MKPPALPEPDENAREQRDYALTLQVFSVAAAMVGVCLTGIGILRLIANQRRTETIGDDLLALDAVLFVACCILAFWSFKTRDPAFQRWLRVIVDTLFLLALSGMAGICLVIAYTLL